MSDFSSIPPRPPTPQPSKYIILIGASIAAAGKIQIARSVASALSCPLYQGDSLHESSAKAASVGGNGPNEARYQRMWLSKLTRTGLLFPEESRPATEGFSGFGGTSSTGTSRRGSTSSIASSSATASEGDHSMSSSVVSSNGRGESVLTSSLAGESTTSMFTQSDEEKRRRANPALMVLTHPELEKWHKILIRAAVGEYGIGVIFVPLYSERKVKDEEEDLPILKPLDPRTMTSFPVSFGAAAAKKMRGWGNLDEEMNLRIDVDADVEGKMAEIVEGVRNVIGYDR
ncbi:hypothetical protein B0H63DRAFT_499278 [Podospora didyma]|uniref:Uncharacterized protein n=1 Tax=Podospora didyma TaxID=330526 RepID=A0AAE0U958_9PEZI|nr:hypothetical protein B0H63DRAFT_499278 [Podospora didyma]